MDLAAVVGGEACVRGGRVRCRNRVSLVVGELDLRQFAQSVVDEERLLAVLRPEVDGVLRPSARPVPERDHYVGAVNDVAVPPEASALPEAIPVGRVDEDLQPSTLGFGLRPAIDSARAARDDHGARVLPRERGDEPADCLLADALAGTNGVAQADAYGRSRGLISPVSSTSTG